MPLQAIRPLLRRRLRHLRPKRARSLAFAAQHANQRGKQAKMAAEAFSIAEIGVKNTSYKLTRPGEWGWDVAATDCARPTGDRCVLPPSCWAPVRGSQHAVLTHGLPVFATDPHNAATGSALDATRMDDRTRPGQNPAGAASDAVDGDAFSHHRKTTRVTPKSA